MKAYHILDSLGLIDDKFILDAKAKRKTANWKRTVLLVALIAAAIALSGFIFYGTAFSDRWLQKPSNDPFEVVRSAIENQIEKEYTISVSVEELVINDAETKRLLELCKIYPEGTQYYEGRFVIVTATYYVEYDHTKTFMPDGHRCQDFYLTQNFITGKWKIVDNTSGYDID